MGEINPKDFVRISFEVESVRAQIKKAILDHAEGVNSLVDQVVNSKLTEDYLRKAINEKVDDEIRSYFNYGEGRKLIQLKIDKKVAEAIEKLEL